MTSPTPSSSTASNASSTCLSRFTRALPKLELHAHLNGSIRRSTLAHLASRRSIDPATTRILARIPSTLSDAFSTFRVIHACVTTLADVERIAYELGVDLERDGVVYAEIRTTPRRLEGRGLDAYVEAVLAGFESYYKEGGGRTVLRLLLSVDRAKHALEGAEEIVDLALRYTHAGVVGVDLSGDPSVGEFSTFVPALTRARSEGLKITLHAGEVRNRDDELSHMLDFAPDRFGHCCFVSDANLQRLKASRVPIELCLTSNLLSNSVPSLTEHHFGLHYRAHEEEEEEAAVCCIATDDSGVFGSSLSNEYRLLMENFGLGERETWSLAKRVVEATFDEEVRERLRSSFHDFDREWKWNN